MRLSSVFVALLATVATFIPTIIADDTAITTSDSNDATNNQDAVAAYDPKKLLCIINKYRKLNNQPYLAFYDGLNDVATAHNDLMAERGELAWQFDDEEPLYDRVETATNSSDWQDIAQLVAYGYADEEEYTKAMSTDSRTMDIFYGNYTHVGLARNDSNNGPWWTQTLAYNAETNATAVECPE
jgi:uncharacterized protein YkwD